MGLFEFEWLPIVITASLMVCTIDCGQIGNLDIGRSTDEKICTAIDRMHEAMSGSLDDKCRKYVVLLFIVTSEGSLYEPTASNVLTMEKDNLNKFYEGIDRASISSLLMSAIDKYRVVGLAPAFIDLVDCLRLIDTPSARAYLSNPEMNVIESLFRQVLIAPGRKIDINHLDIRKFHPSLKRTNRFQSVIRDLSRGYIHFDRTEDCLASDPYGLRSVIDPNDPLNISGTSCSAPKSQQHLEKEQAILRKRERSRLNSHLRRLIHPKVVRRQYRKLRDQREPTQAGQQAQETTSITLVGRKRGRKPLERVQWKQQMRKMLESMQQYHQVQEPGSRQQPDLQNLQVNSVQTMYPEKEEPVVNLMTTYPGSSNAHAHKVVSPSASDQMLSSHLERPEDITIDDLVQSRVSIVPDTEKQHHWQNYYNITGSNDENRQRKCPVSKLQFEPGHGKEECSLHQDLIDCATRPAESESFMQFLLDEPQTSEPVLDPDTAVSGRRSELLEHESRSGDR